MILPVAVILKRRLAPLCVFIFFAGGFTGSVSFLFAFSFPVRHADLGLERGHEHDHGPPFHARRLFDRTVRAKLFGQLIEQRAAQIGMGHLTAAEEDGQLDFVPGIEELRGLTSLRFEVVVVDLGPDADLFQLDDMLMTARLPLFAALLVAELAVVHEPADGRHRIWRHLDQIEATLARHLERIECGDDPYLLAVLINQPDLADPDALVDACLDGSGNTRASVTHCRVSLTTQHRNAPGAISGAAALKAREGVYHRIGRLVNHIWRWRDGFRLEASRGLSVVSGVDWSGDAGDPRKVPGSSPRLITVVAHVERSDWPVFEIALAAARRQRGLGESFVFHHGKCRPVIRQAFFDELRNVPYSAHARIVDKRTWPVEFIRRTSGDERIRSEIVALILTCADDVIGGQILLVDCPKAEMRNVIAIKTAINQALATHGRAGLRLVKPCPDHHRSQGAIIQVADMIAGALHDSGDTSSPYLHSLRGKIQLV